MKKILIPILSLAAVIPAFSQGLDLQNRILLNRQKMMRDGVIKSPDVPQSFEKVKSLRSSNLSATQPSSYINALVKIADGFSVSDLEDLGMNVNVVKGRIAIVTMPIDSVESFSSKSCVAKISLERQLKTNMDKARAFSSIDDIHQGKNIDLPYKGDGVLGIIVDQGVDPNHVAFLDENGKSRVKYLEYFDGTADKYGIPNSKTYGENLIYEDDKGNIQYYPTVDNFTTDLQTAYHGTHTMNIFGGGYSGNITVSENGTLKEIPNAFYGAAPKMDLAVSCGDLGDSSVAWGLYDMLDYADYRKALDGTPAVVSLSLGSTAGPHDPNNLMNAFLDECGEDYIVVVSAGNEGDLKIALNKTFTADDNTLKSLIYPYGFRYEPSMGEYNDQTGNYNTYIRNGIVMIYSNDDTPFQINGFILVEEGGSYRRRANFNLSSSSGVYMSSDTYYTNYVGGSVNSTIARYFDGYIGGGVMLDESLGRYYGAFDYYLFSDPSTAINEDGSEKVIIGFEVIGENGQRIDCFCDGENTWISNYGLDGYEDGSRNGTISDMAVGNKILVVGAYNNRNKWEALNGQEYTYADMEGFEDGFIGPYSSFGTLADGRTLPHVCAPGTGVMSAVSTPWIEYYFRNYPNYISYNTTAKATVDGRDYYWKPETGTSMSTPLVAGSIALWLEADPTLTIEDIYDIIEKTSIRDSQVAAGDPVQWGAGKFDALAGLKEVINRREAGVGQLVNDDRNDRLILTETAPGVFNIFVGNAKTLNVNVFSVAGSQVASASVHGNETTVDLSGMSPGIYVVKANNHVSKILVK